MKLVFEHCFLWGGFLTTKVKDKVQNMDPNVALWDLLLYNVL